MHPVGGDEVLADVAEALSLVATEDRDASTFEDRCETTSALLRLVSREVEFRDRFVERQRTALLEALHAVERTADERDCPRTFLECLDDLRAAVADVSGNPDEVDRTLRSVTTDLLDRVDRFEDETARRLRRPLYEFLEMRIDTQLVTVGYRSSTEER